MSNHTPGTASPASGEGPDLIAEIGGIRITRAQSPAQLAERIANIAGEARWFGYHEQKLSGANPKDCAVARSDAQVLADAAFVLNNLNEMLEIAAHSGRPSPASDTATIAQDATKLLPCPFCGGDAAMLRKVLRDGYENFKDDPDAYAHSVACHACAAEGGWAKSESGARRWWNTRIGGKNV